MRSVVGRDVLHVLDERGDGVLGSLLAESEARYVVGGKRVRERGRGRVGRGERVARAGLEDLGEAVSRELVERGGEELVCAYLAREVDNGLVMESKGTARGIERIVRSESVSNEESIAQRVALTIGCGYRLLRGCSVSTSYKRARSSRRSQAFNVEGHAIRTCSRAF